jgi:replicative DNA helicase
MPETATLPALRLVGSDALVAARKPPHNIEAEQALLGSILVNNVVYEKVGEISQPAHFYDPVHGRIYEAIATLINRGQIADPKTLRGLFESDPALTPLGGAQYLADLAASVITIINAEDYAQLIRDHYLRRQLITLGEDVVNDAFRHDLDKPATAQIEATEHRLFELAKTGELDRGFVKLERSLVSSIRMAEEAFRRDSHVTGVTTGLRDLDRKLGGLQRSDLIILAGRPSMGKAQPLDARIKTTTGWKTMGELKLGDALASIDGRASRVVGLYPQGRKTIYRITFSDGRTTEACADHLWRIYYRDWENSRVLSTTQLIEMLKRKRYQNRLWIDHCSGHFGHSNELPIDAWVLGALLGDGCLKGTTARFSTASPEMLATLTTRLGEQFYLRAAGGYDWSITQSAGRVRTGHQGVGPNPLKEALIELDLWDRGSEKKFVPDTYLNANRQVRLELLRGLLDTDGWVEKGGSIRFSSTSEKLALDVVELARSLGGWATLVRKSTSYKYKGIKKNGRPSWMVNIYHPQPSELFTLPEKRARLGKTIQRHRMQVIRDISVSRKAEAQCIAVSHPEKLYITDNYVVTHNTALATNIAFSAARKFHDSAGKEGAAVAFFSLEMSSEQLATRLLGEHASVPSDKIRRGEIKTEDFAKFVEASKMLAAAPLYIDDTPGLSVASLRTRARRLKRMVPHIGVIVIDYLQLLRGSARREENRVQEVSEITRGLKALAKELDVPVLALSQLSRAVEAREDKKPQLADLRESGSIEQDADVVMFVYREEYYHARSEPTRRQDEPEEKYNTRHQRWMERGEEIRNIAEVLIAKQRHGPIGTVELHFDGPFTRFSDLERRFNEPAEGSPF